MVLRECVMCVDGGYCSKVCVKFGVKLDDFGRDVRGLTVGLFSVLPSEAINGHKRVGYGITD